MEITNIILEETYIRDGITKCRDTTKHYKIKSIRQKNT